MRTFRIKFYGCEKPRICIGFNSLGTHRSSACQVNYSRSAFYVCTISGCLLAVVIKELDCAVYGELSADACAACGRPQPRRCLFSLLLGGSLALIAAADGCIPAPAPALWGFLAAALLQFGAAWAWLAPPKNIKNGNG